MEIQGSRSFDASAARYARSVIDDLLRVSHVNGRQQARQGALQTGMTFWHPTVTDIHTVARVLRLFNQAYPRAVQYFHKIPARATDEELLALAPKRLVIALREKIAPEGKA